MLELIEGGVRIEIEATTEEVIKALDYIKHQRKLQHEKYKRLFVPTGNKPGPKPKHPPAEQKPKRSVGRPRKFPLPSPAMAPMEDV